MADPVTPDNPEEGVDDRPAWLPENFESPEALAQSYKEAQRKITEMSQQNRAMEENYSSLAEQVEEMNSRPTQYSPSDLQAQLYEKYEADPLGTTALLANQAAAAMAAQIEEKLTKQFGSQVNPAVQSQQELTAQYAWDGLKAANPDFTNYEDKVTEFIRENPHYLPREHLGSTQQVYNDLENVYKIVSRDDVANTAAQAAEQAAQFARMKQDAQTLSGSSGFPMPPDAEKAEWDRIRAASKSGW